jgi:hypothetical protein
MPNGFGPSRTFLMTELVPSKKKFIFAIILSLRFITNNIQL